MRAYKIIISRGAEQKRELIDIRKWRVLGFTIK